MGVVAPIAGGVHVFVRLTPRASREEICGIAEGVDGASLQVRVRAVPEKGKANKALLELLAKWLGVAKSDVTLVGGGKSRLKRIHIAGSSDELIDAVNSRIAELS